MSAKALKTHLPHFGSASAPMPEVLKPSATIMKPLHEPKAKVEAPAKPKMESLAQPKPVRPVKEAAPDPAVVLAAAVEAARAETLAAARLEFEAERARDAEAFEAHLGLARQQWAVESATGLAEGLKGAMAEMEERIATAAGRILMPFLAEAVRARAVDELVGHVKRLMSTPEAPVVRVSGPEDLLNVLRARCDGTGIEFQPNQDVDVRVTADDTVIETQLRAWGAQLTEALA
ncbi:hypothetical protein [Azorhizobium doebereinerae]|uniref:hypothetical protein n=1 Tax=Azorhizobium doebereinerae TaxID=281091 RepID=UPI000406EF34|nr:hypothetical protein [Azorhizobium doebereinerae]